MSAPNRGRVAAVHGDAGYAPRSKPGPGRRRDPEIDGKIRHAARTIYANAGWAGFHFDGVAKAAGVSKDSVYRRYADREALLLASLADRGLPSLKTGPAIEDSMIEYAVAIYDYLSGGDGYAYLRVQIDGPQYPEILREYQERILLPTLAGDVAVLDGARQAGLLAEDTDCEAVITALTGALFIFTLSRPHSDQRERPTVHRRIREIVRQILRGAET